METCINYCERDGWAYMSSDEKRWITRIRKLATARPDECIIMKQPEDNGGFIYARFPQKWARVNPPRQVIMTEEQRVNWGQKMRSTRKSVAIETDGDDGE